MPQRSDDETDGDVRPMLITTDPRKFLEIAANKNAKERLAALSWIDDILLSEIVHYGIFNDEGLIPDLQQFYSHVIQNGMPERLRRRVFDHVRDS